MLGAADLVAFVGTADLGRARAFYEGMLGLRLVEDAGFALVFDAGGTMLRVTEVPAVVPAPYTVLGWTVPDIRAAVAALGAAGVAFEHFEGMDQDADGVWTSPGGALVAWCKDPDGNVLSLTEAPGGD
jgi:catechol 2,3-dioxygenase-like lactoylglutathione lyase family enzyme